MEKNMEEVKEKLDQAKIAFEQLKASMKQYDQLSAYYSSQDWFDDVQLYQDGKLPADIKAGILSEDGLYDVFGDMYEYALSQLEFVSEYMRKH